MRTLKLDTLEFNAGDGISQFGDWEFNKSVAQKFEEHITKSVPLYPQIQDLVCSISDWFVHSGGTVYDLGCGTGFTLKKLAQRHLQKNISLIGIDDSAEMLQEAKHYLKDFSTITLVQEKVNQHAYPENVDLFCCLYTLQFLPLGERQKLLASLYQSLSSHGALIVVEKVLDPDSFFADIFLQLHWTKKLESFSMQEIFDKAKSLRSVLVPITPQENLELLYEVGFHKVSTFFRWCNFAGFLAVK